jgi:hypothetical protein
VWHSTVLRTAAYPNGRTLLSNQSISRGYRVDESVQYVGYGMDHRGSNPGRGWYFFSSHFCVQTGSASFLFNGYQAAKAWSYTSTPQYVFMARCLRKTVSSTHLPFMTLLLGRPCCVYSLDPSFQTPPNWAVAKPTMWLSGTMAPRCSMTPGTEN